MNTKITVGLLTFIVSLFYVGCGTTDASLQNQGKSSSYIQGFHDGRHSGMSEEGNHYEHFIRDEARYKADPDYKRGWLAGEAEGIHLQDQAVAVGSAIGGSYSTSKINQAAEQNQDFDKIANDTLKKIDTTGLENLK